MGDCSFWDLSLSLKSLLYFVLQSCSWTGTCCCNAHISNWASLNSSYGSDVCNKKNTEVNTEFTMTADNLLLSLRPLVFNSNIFGMLLNVTQKAAELQICIKQAMHLMSSTQQVQYGQQHPSHLLYSTPSALHSWDRTALLSLWLQCRQDKKSSVKFHKNYSICVYICNISTL